MFDDQPGGPGQDQPQGKLILRGHNNNAPANPQGDTVFFPPAQAPSSPEQMQTYYPPSPTMQAPYTPPPPTQQPPYAPQYLPQQGPYGPGGPGPRKGGDPIYKFLIIAIVVVIFSGIVFAAFASGIAGQILAQGNRSGQTSTTTSTPPSQNTQGGTSANQATPTPFVPTPTPTLAPTPTPVPQFPLQITDINGQTPMNNNAVQVSNNSSVQVNVHMSQPDPNARVRLLITYKVAPGIARSARKHVDGNGDVQLTWNVHVFNFGQNAGNVTATVVAASFDQNGQQIAESAPVTVQIMTGNNNNGGGNNNNGNNNNNGGNNNDNNN